MNVKERKEAFIEGGKAGGKAGGKRREKFNYIIIPQNEIKYNKFKKTFSLTLCIS